VPDPDATPRRRLPDAALPPLVGGPPVPLRVPRHSAALVLLGGAPGPAERDFLAQLAADGASVTGWDGRVLVVVSGAAAGSAAAGSAAVSDEAEPFPVLADPAGTVAAAAGVTPPALVVADQWGEVHWHAPAGDGRPWPPVREVEQWARFLAIRCAG
jgi:hypothetical protein